jgi:superfamily II DNA or RNA helicase
MQILQSRTTEFAGSGNDRQVRVGDRVRVRRQRWIVTDVRPHSACAFVTLSGLGPANHGLEQIVITPFDHVESLAAPRRLRRVGSGRWRRACRELIADDGPAGRLRSARAAQMDIMPHQLEPALAVVRGLGSRILIADEVGLGKTVQAALVVGELNRRGAATRVLIITPAGLREQWADEFAKRFDLPLALFDTLTIARHRASLPVGVNPWSIEPLIVTSIDYIKRPEVVPAIQSCRWDVVIVDEAHHVAVGTDRYEAVAALCRRAPYVLLLTATPHNGDSRAFASLCAIGRHHDSLLVFRRTRADIGRAQERRVHQLRVRPNAAERHMHACLAAFVRAVQHERGCDPETWLALSTLRKRALSSAFALRRSVERRLDALGAQNDGILQQLTLPLGDPTGEFDRADDVPLWTIPSLCDSRQERALLTRIADAAALASRRETKLAALNRLLRRIGEPALVFTEYRDTLLHIRDTITPDAAVIHGGLSRDERRVALATFSQGGVLLATDAAGEGLNLHHACRVVVNLELPWNPMRLEQRIGRVDRIGQQRRVHAFHLIAAGTMEVRMLDRLAARIARAQADVGAQDPLGGGNGEVSIDRPELTILRLTTEAQNEYQRLVQARQMDGGACGSESRGCCGADGVGAFEAGTLAAVSRRRSIRSQLGSRILVLFRSHLTDETGRIVASHLIPALLRPTNGSRRSLDELDAIGLTLTNGQAYRGWLAESLAVHDAFCKTRGDREQAIANTRDQAGGGELQPGLFDLRAAQERIQVIAQQRDTALDDAWHTIEVTRASALTLQRPQPALVLLP